MTQKSMARTGKKILRDNKINAYVFAEATRTLLGLGLENLRSASWSSKP